MKNVIKILIGLLFSLFLLWSGFRLFIDYITEGKRGESISYSIEESKASGAFICEFKLTELDSVTRQKLIKYDYLEPLNSTQIWLEKGHKYVNKNLYINELKFLDKYRLIIQNPRKFKEMKDSTLSMKVIKGEYPDFGIREENDFELVSMTTNKSTSQKIRFGSTSEVRNRSGANRHNFSQEITMITLPRPKNEIDFWVYLSFMKFQVDDIIIGKVKIKSGEYILKDDFIDNRHWWEKINI